MTIEVRSVANETRCADERHTHSDCRSSIELDQPGMLREFAMRGGFDQRRFVSSAVKIAGYNSVISSSFCT